MGGRIVILGVFVADAAFRAAHQPRMGETLIGTGFRLGPGGKGSNQAVAAAQAGGDVHFISRIGQDSFGEMALATWREAGVQPAVLQSDDGATGAACIFIEEGSGENAIIIAPGAGAGIGPEDIARNAALFEGAALFMTQLEQPMEAALAGLRAARAAGARTILNPAPAAALPDGMLALSDFVTPNETEAEGLTGIRVDSLDSARRAARALIAQGAGAALITLGAEGVLFDDGRESRHLPAFDAGAVIDTTGAGDAFNGAFAAALADGLPPAEAARFGCAAAGISVTRPGTAPAMPTREEIVALLGTKG